MADQQTIRVKVKDLYRLRDKYMFRKPNEERVTEMRAAFKAADGKWPFPPVLLAERFPVTLADEYKVTKSKDGEEQQTNGTKGEYLLVGGYHRLEVAEAEGVKEIPAVVESMNTVADVLARAFTDNKEHGLLPRKADIYRAVRRLHDNGANYALISELTGLTRASISRIISGKQGEVAGGARERRKGGKGKGKAKSEAATVPWSLDTWIEAMKTLGAEYRQHRADIVPKILPETTGLLDALFQEPAASNAQKTAAPSPETATTEPQR